MWFSPLYFPPVFVVYLNVVRSGTGAMVTEAGRKRRFTCVDMTAACATTKQGAEKQHIQCHSV